MEYLQRWGHARAILDLSCLLLRETYEDYYANLLVKRLSFCEVQLLV